MSFFKKHPFLTALVLALVLGLLIAASLRGNEISRIESGVGNVVAPASSAFSRFTNGVGSWFRMVFGISDVQKEVTQLRERNAQLENELIVRREQALENERLKAMLKLVEDDPDNKYMAARVIGKNPGYWFTSFLINQGRNHGAKVGCVVVNAEGVLVGRISETGGNWSRVESIIDANSNISAIIERTRDDVMVRGVASISGDDSDRLCEIYTLPLDNDLQPGDVIVTSGLGEMGGMRMPKGIPIGEVISVDISSASIERTAMLQPKAGFTGLEEVLVIVEAGADEEEIEPVTDSAPLPDAMDTVTDGSLVPVDAPTPSQEGVLSTPGDATEGEEAPIPSDALSTDVDGEPNVAPAFGSGAEDNMGNVTQSSAPVDSATAMPEGTLSTMEPSPLQTISTPIPTIQTQLPIIEVNP